MRVLSVEYAPLRPTLLNEKNNTNNHGKKKAANEAPTKYTVTVANYNGNHAPCVRR